MISLTDNKIRIPVRQNRNDRLKPVKNPLAETGTLKIRFDNRNRDYR